MTTPSLHSLPIQQQREAVSLYISSLANEITQSRPDTAFDGLKPLPDFVTGTRRKYLETLHAHVLAKRELAEAAATPAAAGTEVVPDCGDAIIVDRANSARQRQHRTSLDALSRHVTAFEKLLPKSHPDTNQQNESSISTAAATSDNLEHSRARSHKSEELLRTLEISVFKARMRVEKARVNNPSDDDNTHSAVTRLRALRAVHDALTAWIEESLAACASPAVDQDDQDDGRQPDNKDESELETAYDRYVQGRKSMTAAIDILSQPLPSLGEGAAATTTSTSTVRGDARDQRAGGAIMSGMKASLDGTIQQRVSSWQRIQRSKLILQYARAELNKESEETAARLDRLADESQLLPAYPRLVKLPGPPTVKTRSEAWSFASAAADVTLEAAIDRDLTDGNKAMDEAMKTLRDLSLLRDLLGA